MIFFTRAALASVVSRGMLACRVSIDCADSKRGPQARQAGGDPGVVGNGALHKHAFTPFQLTHRTVGWATFFAPLTPALSNSSMSKLKRRKRVFMQRSEEHTSELQSHSDLVCRLL